MLLLNRFSQWLNERSGMGGKGDMSGGSFKARNRISSSQIENLFRQSLILRNMCEAYPENIIKAWREFGSENDKWQEIEDSYNLESTVEQALIWTEVFGGALLVPRYSRSSGVTLARMGRPFRDPPSGSLLGFKIYKPHELRDFNRNGTQTERQENGLPVLYDIGKNRRGNSAVPIHYSWTIPFFGPYSSVKTSIGHGHATCEELFGESKIDMVYDDFINDGAGLRSISHLLNKSSIDVLKLPGLGRALSECSTDTGQQALSQAMSRAALGVQGASAFQPMIIDGDEDMKRMQLSGAQGIASMSQVLTDRFVGSTRVPRTILLGEQANGINNGGEADMEIFNDRSGAFRRRRLTVPLRAIDNFISIDQATEVPPWTYGELKTLNAKQRAECDNKNAETDRIYFEMDIPFIKTKISERLQLRYGFTDDELREIAITEGADPEA